MDQLTSKERVHWILRIKLVILYRTILHNLAQSCTVLYLYNTGDLSTLRKIENVQVSVM